MSDDKGRQRLGRGLASLIGGSASTAPATPRSGVPGGTPFASPAGRPRAAEPGERLVAPGAIGPNPRNPRRTFNEDELAELTASVRQHGVVQPILVRPATDGRFEIVAGERRWRAATAAGLAAIPVVVREITDRQSLEIAIIENVQRADLNAIEEALGYEQLLQEHGYTQSELAETIGKSRSHVANTLRLLKLPDAVREMVVRGELSAGAARTAVSQDDPETFARRIVDGGMSVREAETLARGDEPPAARSPRAGRGGTPPVAPRPASPEMLADAVKDADTRALERLLSETLECPVEIDLQGERGTMRLGFRSLDQLDELCRLLQARMRPDADAQGPRVRSL